MAGLCGQDGPVYSFSHDVSCQGSGDVDVGGHIPGGDLPTLMGPDTTVVTLQNGMGNAEEIARIIPADRIYVGLCFICACLLYTSGSYKGCF